MARYELIERIGIGGMAEIFRGQATSGGGFVKPVAIKRILPHLCQDERFVEQLISEANVLAKLRHRNIVQIYDVGISDDGQKFLVMEYVDGINLADLYEFLERSRVRFPTDLALHIGAEICEALEHAHVGASGDGNEGLVHRDISPGNILLSKSGEVKLSNFGIAKHPDEQTSHDTVRGKFAYIAPEQASGERVDARSDVFALGIVLYEYMTGQRLFSRLSDAKALEAVRAGTMPLPSTQDPELPREIENLLIRALAPLPADRFQSASAFGAKMRELRYSMEEEVSEPTSQIRSWVSRCRSAEIPSKHSSDYNPGFAEEKTVIKVITAPGFDSSGVVPATGIVEKKLEEPESPPVDDASEPEIWEDSKTRVRIKDERPAPRPSDPEYLAKLKALSSSPAAVAKAGELPRAESSTTAVRAPGGHSVIASNTPPPPSIAETPAPADPGGWGAMQPDVAPPVVEVVQPGNDQSRWLWALGLLLFLVVGTAIVARIFSGNDSDLKDRSRPNDSAQQVDKPVVNEKKQVESPKNSVGPPEPEAAIIPVADEPTVELEARRETEAQRRKARRARKRRERKRRRRRARERR